MKNCEQQPKRHITVEIFFHHFAMCVCVDFSSQISKGYSINIGCDALIEDCLLVAEEWQKLRVSGGNKNSKLARIQG